MTTKFVFLIGLVVQTATLINAAKRNDILQSSCLSPPLDKSITKEWMEKSTPSGGWYFLMVSKSDTKASPQNVLTHKIIPQRITDDEFCPRMTWADGVGEFSFFGQTWVVFKCITNGTYAFQQCKAYDADNQEGEVENLHIFMTESDNQTYIFILRCWEDGTQDWTLASTNGNKLSENLKERILDHANSLGFDRDEYEDISYEKCSG